MKIVFPLRARRLRAGIGLRELARVMDISAPYLREIELGTRRFTPEMKVRHRDAMSILRPRKPTAGFYP